MSFLLCYRSRRREEGRKRETGNGKRSPNEPTL